MFLAVLDAVVRSRAIPHTQAHIQAKSGQNVHQTGLHELPSVTSKAGGGQNHSSNHMDWKALPAKYR